MGKNKLDPINFCKIFDMFGEEAASQTLDDVNAGKISEATLENISTTAPKPKNNTASASSVNLRKDKYHTYQL